uniref:Saccharopine dehydrogenase NADP binding domain-containing protein n=1 Tax=viral metagenome TaxID=1070528 RepID=A0A6C0HV74_9ZZZZ
MTTKAKRLEMLQNFPKYDFGSSHLWLLGQGAIGTGLLYMILKLFKINLEQITVIDMPTKVKPKEQLIKDVNDIVKIVRGTTDNKINIISLNINQRNYKKIFKTLSKNDLIIDCVYCVSTLELLKLCQEVGCVYVNSCVEIWDYKDIDSAYDYTIHAKVQELKEYESSVSSKFTAMTGIGCNPGMVSVWAQLAIEKINKYYGNKIMKTAEELGIRTVHISEIDTQRCNVPKKINEYCNTWGSTMEPLYEEALAPLEMSFGTHEDIPKRNLTAYEKDKSVIILDRLALNTFAQSYTPLYGNFIGMLIRHEENITIGDKLSTFKEIKGQRVKTYAPSVYYVYRPSNDTMASLAELRDRNYEYQDNWRFLTNEIIDGRDELGLTFFLKNGDIFWIGSLLDIHEAREVYGNNFSHKMNATSVQVVGGYLSGIMHMMDLHKLGKYGLYTAEDLPYRDIYNKMKPFYGDFVFKKVNKWDYRDINKPYQFTTFIAAQKEKKIKKVIPKMEWKLSDFLVNPESVIGISKCVNYKQKKECN